MLGFAESRACTVHCTICTSVGCALELRESASKIELTRRLENMSGSYPSVDSVIKVIDAQPSPVEHRTLARGGFQYLMNENHSILMLSVFYPPLRLEAAIASI